MMPESEPNPSINPPDNEVEEVDTLRTWREVPPAHYILKIKSFSSLVRILKKTGLDNYESREFETSGLTWKLLLYPSGDENRNGSGHISLYLKLTTSSRIVNAVLIFFIYDQLKYKYLSIQDTRVRRFDEKKKQWGLSLDCFKNASNEFLVNDSCVFGVEVFVVNEIRVTDKGVPELKHGSERICFHTVPNLSEKAYVWKVEKLSRLQESGHFSEPFFAGNCIWKFHLYRKGIPKVKGKYMSLYLCLQDDPWFPPGWKMHVEFQLSVNDQGHQNNSDKIEKRGNAWFSASDTAWGFPYFLSLADKGKLKSLTIGDAMKIELQIISILMPMTNGPTPIPTRSSDVSQSEIMSAEEEIDPNMPDNM